MARRRKDDGLADDIIAIVATLTWWAGVALAAVSYLFLHAINGRPGQPGDAAGMLTHTLAFFGQFVLPCLFLIGALVSYLRRGKAQQVYAAAGQGGNAIAAMSWRDFETLTAEYFRRRGFAVTSQAQGGPDGGVDVELSKHGDRYLVQCKQWRAMKVGVETVRELYGVMSARRAAGGFIVTSGRFTDAAQQFAAGREIELIDGKVLERAIREQQATVPGGAHSRPNAAPYRRDPAMETATSPGIVKAPAQSGASFPAATRAEPTAASHTISTAPTCPACSAPMALRVARKGANAGQEFWGCTRYVQGCRGTRARTIAADSS